MAVTIKKIAELAGVSAGTVDRVINNRGKVKPEVEARIKEIATSLNYKPNQIGRTLSMLNKNFKIAVILHTEGNLYFDYVLQGINKAKEEITHNGCSVDIFYGKDFDAEYQLGQINKAIANNANAIIIVPIEDDLIKAKLNELAEKKFPVFLLSNMLSKTRYCEYVGCNYYEAGNLAAGFVSLISNTEPKIAFFTPSFNMLGHRLRFQGFAENKKLRNQKSTTKVIEIKKDGMLSAYGTAYEFLSENRDINIIVSHGSGLNDGIIRAINDLGLSDKVKIVAYDMSEQIKNLLKENQIVACIDQSPVEQGYQIIKSVFNDFLVNQFPDDKDTFIPLRILICESLANL